MLLRWTVASSVERIGGNAMKLETTVSATWAKKNGVAAKIPLQFGFISCSLWMEPSQKCPNTVSVLHGKSVKSYLILTGRHSCISEQSGGPVTLGRAELIQEYTVSSGGGVGILLSSLFGLKIYIPHFHLWKMPEAGYGTLMENQSK